MAVTPDKEDGREVKPRISLVEFVRQVRQEGSKVTWPTRKETMLTTMMVFIMVVISMIFFYAVDSIFGFAVQTLIST